MRVIKYLFRLHKPLLHERMQTSPSMTRGPSGAVGGEDAHEFTTQTAADFVAPQIQRASFLRYLVSCHNRARRPHAESAGRQSQQPSVQWSRAVLP